MYMPLETINVWEIQGHFTPSNLFSSLHLVLCHGDYIVIGAYNPSTRSMRLMKKNEMPLKISERHFIDSFDANRDEYPNGKAYVFKYNTATLDLLLDLSNQKRGSKDIDLFFDHVLAYRPTSPMIPLMDFHDAFNGGTLYFSGLYDKNTIFSFARTLNATPKNYFHPAIKNMLKREE